ncbi:MAG: YdeI/OmpD-associated family protein [Chloroflexota bacterium]
MAKLEPTDVRFFATPAELRDWFDANHATATELWLGRYKKASGRPSVTWPEAVDEALCVGWIDGILKGIDDISVAQRLTPRRKGSNWSAVNVANVERLMAEGRMRPAGIAAFEARTPERTGVYSYEREIAPLSDEEIARFQADAAAWADWEGRPPSYRRTVTNWITTAKQPATRERRLATLIEDSRAGRPIKALSWERKKDT